MDKDNGVTIIEKIKQIKNVLPKFSITNSRVEQISEKLELFEEIKKQDEKHLVTINIGTTVCEVDVGTAINVMSSAYHQELGLVHMYNERLNKALEYLNGEHDVYVDD